MKKITTLAFASIALLAVHAQSSKQDALNKLFGANTSVSSNSVNQDRQTEINKVNREYDIRITAVRSDIRLNAQEKQRRIDALNAERAQRIAEINARYNNNGGNTGGNSGGGTVGGIPVPGTSTDGSRGTTTDKKVKYKKKNKDGKSDNGRHLGWEKGKGNPHKNGGKPKGKSKD